MKTYISVAIATLAAFGAASVIWSRGNAASSGVTQAKPQPQQLTCNFDEPATTPAQVVCAFYESAARGDVERAMSFQRNEIDPTKQIVMNIPVRPGHAMVIKTGGVSFSKLKSEVIEDYKAEVIAETKNSNGRVNDVIHHLYKIDGEWKIAFIFSYDSLCELAPEQCHIIEQPKAAN